MPSARGDLTLQEVGSEGLLYDREAGMVHILNRTALCAWKICDGSHSADEIASRLGEVFPGGDPVAIRDDVLQILTSFAERGLLEPGC
jgi:hypothetical protein